MGISLFKQSYKTSLLCAALCAVLALPACSNVKKEAKYPTGADRPDTGGDIYAKPQSIFGEDGLAILKNKGTEEEKAGSSIGVNSFLWRATLDTVSFMPLASADPFGGVVLTDWYSPPENPNERFKMNVFILDRQLRSDGVQVRVFRQVREGGEWRDAKASEDTASKLEETILTRARHMRVAQ